MGFMANLLLGMLVLSATLPLAPLQQCPGQAFAAACEPPSVSHMRSPSAGQILINEVMYDPVGNEVQGEWVELHNPGSHPVNVTAWTISDQEGDVDFTFPEMEFPAGGYALVHVKSGQNSTEFVVGKAEFFMWRGTALLSNNGDDVLLSDSHGNTVDFMSYGTGSSVGPVPADFNYTHPGNLASEGLSLARTGGEFRASVPTPLYPNGDDSAPPLLLTEVHYYSWGDNEFFTVHNPLAHAADISSWYMTDLEGSIAFPVGTVLGPGMNLTVAQNGANYLAQTLRLPDFDYTGSHAPAMQAIKSAPVLANTGDEVILRNNFATTIDAFVYGSSAYLGPGWSSAAAPAQPQGRVAKRNFAGGYVDTNTSADWENVRQYVIGQSEFAVSSFEAQGPVTLFASPDSSFATLAGAIDNATDSIWASLYEFTGQHLAEKVLGAIGRGVEVRVFLEGAPVGGMSGNGLHIARRIVEAGGQVRMMTSDASGGIYARYSFSHAKYAIIDSDTLAVMSENWGQSGIPRSGTAGNRGWGAIIRDSALAGYFADVFLEDWEPERSDSVEFGPGHLLWDAGSQSEATTSPLVPRFQALTLAGPCTVTPVLAPDTSLSGETVLGMVGSASERLLVHGFYAYKHWGPRASGSVESTPNIYLEAVMDAARRGVSVRVLLDSTYYNVQPDDPIDNDDTVEYINAIAAAENLDMQAKLVNLDEHGFEKIHNKGLVADGSVLVSSINWNLNSVTRNREAGVIIRNREAADYFAAIFDFDWIDDLTPPFAHFRAEDSYAANVTLSLDASTSSDNVGIVNYTWFLDGLPVWYDKHFIHIFEAPGAYSVTLMVRDAWGNAATFTRTLNVTAAAQDQQNGTDGTGSDIPGSQDGSMVMMIALLLLIPVFIFLAVLMVARVRRR